MNDRQLKYILTIVEEGNLTAAAQKLFISQPSLSGLLANIEKELEVKLFYRSATAMTLTYAGEEYVNSAHKILSIYGDLRQTLADIKGGYTGRIKFGCGPRLSPYLIPLILPGFMKAYPKIQIDLFEHDRQTLEQKLITGGLDIAITTLNGSGNKSIDYWPLYEEEYMLITDRSTVNLSDSTNNTGTVDLREFMDTPFVLLKSIHQVRKAVSRIFEEQGFAPRIILETDSSETCLRLAECGMACTILPIGNITASHDDKISLYSIHADYKRYLCLCLRKDAHRSKIMNAFCDYVTSAVGENKPQS